jgi:hypothetical protein
MEEQAASSTRHFGVPEVDVQAHRIVIGFLTRYGDGVAAEHAIASVQMVISRNRRASVHGTG